MGSGHGTDMRKGMREVQGVQHWKNPKATEEDAGFCTMCDTDLGAGGQKELLQCITEVRGQLGKSSSCWGRRESGPGSAPWPVGPAGDAR